MKQPSLKATLGLIIVLACCSGATLARAKAARFESSAGVIGDVVAVANDNRTYLLTLKAESGAMVTIIVDEATQVKQLSAGERSIENAHTIAASDIVPGDHVYARGARPDNIGTARARQLIVISRTGAIPAQQVAGVLGGQVTDQMGDPIRGAALLLIREDGAESRSVTNTKGIYMLDGLAPGSYTLRIAFAGFTPYENAQVRVQAGCRQTLDIMLQAK